MNPRFPLRGGRLVLAAATAALTLVFATEAGAQYQWRDSQGRMVYSDQPPPASVAPARIIRAPAVARAGPAAGTEQTAVAPTASSKSADPAPGEANLSNADREMAFRKRLGDRAEEEKKTAEAAQHKLELARACSDAQADIRTLESGQRISRVGGNGEREFLSDAERAQRLAQARTNVGERC